MVNYEEDILKMDFKQLREKVEELDTIIARMKREIESRLTNLDESNFATHINKQRDGMKAEIEITAEKLQSTYTKGEVQSQITQTAEEIRTEVSDAIEDVESVIRQTAGSISSRVTALDSRVTNIEQTATEISLSVVQDFTPMFSQATTGSGAPTSNTDKSKLYYDGEDYYFYNDSEEEWQRLEDNEIMTSIVLSANGVKVTGNMIVNGLIEGVGLKTSPVDVYGNSVEIRNADGGIQFYQGNNVEAVIREMYDTTDGVNKLIIQAVSGGASGQSKVVPKGTWDFENANVVNLTPYLYFS